MTRAGGRGERFSRSVRSLRIRNYRLFFVGHAVSVSGTWMQRVAQDWVVLQLTGSALDLGTTTALQFTPLLLFGLWGGVLADRLDRRRTLIVTQTLQLVLAAALAALAWADALTLGAIYAFALALGLVTVVDQPARQSIVTDLVDRDDYANAQVLNSAANNLGKFLGPALAGGVIAWAGAATAFTINAASFVGIVVGLALMNPAAMHPREPVPRARGQIREGLRYVWSRSDLRTAVGLLVVMALLGQNFRVVLPLVADELFNGDASTYGILLAAIGVGAVLAAITTAGRETRPSAAWCSPRWRSASPTRRSRSVRVSRSAPRWPWWSASRTSWSTRSCGPCCNSARTGQCTGGCWPCTASCSSAARPSAPRCSAG